MYAHHLIRQIRQQWFRPGSPPARALHDASEQARWLMLERSRLIRDLQRARRTVASLTEANNSLLDRVSRLKEANRILEAEVIECHQQARRPSHARSL